MTDWQKKAPLAQWQVGQTARRALLRCNGGGRILCGRPLRDDLQLFVNGDHQLAGGIFVTEAVDSDLDFGSLFLLCDGDADGNLVHIDEFIVAAAGSVGVVRLGESCSGAGSSDRLVQLEQGGIEFGGIGAEAVVFVEDGCADWLLL